MDRRGTCVTRLTGVLCATMSQYHYHQEEKKEENVLSDFQNFIYTRSFLFIINFPLNFRLQEALQNYTRALFTSKKFYKIEIVARSFVFDKYYPITD